MPNSNHRYQHGDLVTANPLSWNPRQCAVPLYVIERVPTGARGVNYTVRPADPETHEAIPGARGLRGPAHSFNPYDPNAPKVTDDYRAAHEVTTLPYVATPDAGALVRLNADAPPFRGLTPGELLMVLGDAQNRPGVVRVVKLNGDGRTYWRVPATVLTRMAVKSTVDRARGVVAVTLTPAA